MKKIASLISAAFTYFCIATVIAILTAMSALWVKGVLDQGRLYRVLAALHGIDVITMQQQFVDQQQELDSEQPSQLARRELEMLKTLDLDLRETAINKAQAEMKSLQTAVTTDRARFDELKKAYSAKLELLAEEEQATSLKELQRTLEAIKPAQAKEQIVKMLEDDAMDDVVTILKSMAIDKRKKIIAEFKAGPDTEWLYDILKNIRMGEPLVSQIKEAQDQINESGPQ